jgi:hypothetical protein
MARKVALTTDMECKQTNDKDKAYAIFGATFRMEMKYGSKSGINY